MNVAFAAASLFFSVLFSAHSLKVTSWHFHLDKMETSFDTKPELELNSPVVMRIHD